MIELDDRVLSYERVRLVSAEWSEMLRAVDACARRMSELGESNHARALDVDMRHLERRAHLHLRQIASQEAAKGISTRPPPMALDAEVALIPCLRPVTLPP